MTILSTVCTKLLCTNAHLGRRVAAHHLKVYTRGSRNGIAILDSDKTLICLRSALHFIGSLIRKKGHSFFLKTNHLFIYLIMEKMRYSIMEKMGSCINDSQWKIGAFLTNSYANPKKFRSRKKKIHFGLNQQPDCVVIPNPDRKSSVILEANRSQIPIASLVDSTIPWEFYKRITYPIPANDTIQFIYLFRNSITKTVILERPRITARVKVHRGFRCYASASDPKGGKRIWWRSTFISIYFMGLGTLLSPQRMYFLWLGLSLILCVESAAAASVGDIVVAHPPGSSGYTTNDLVDHLMDTSSASSGEPSVNQPTPEFLPVQQEVEQRAQLQQEIQHEIMELYRNFILESSFWMKYNPAYLTGPDITNVAQLIMEQCDLELLPPAELDEFLQDIRANPRQLDVFFKELWGRGRRGR